jgi:integrase/recombinase XerD
MRVPKRRQKGADSLLRPQTGWPADSLRATMGKYLEAMAVLNASEATRTSRAVGLLRFARWAEERAITKPAEVTRPLLEAFQRHLFYARKANGKPLGAVTQAHLLTSVRQYFRFCVRQGLLGANPASELQLPKLGLRLPRHTLTPSEVEKVLHLVDDSTLAGLQLRAMLEVLWATGLRRSEVVKLSAKRQAPCLCVRGRGGGTEWCPSASAASPGCGGT